MSLGGILSSNSTNSFFPVILKRSEESHNGQNKLREAISYRMLELLVVLYPAARGQQAIEHFEVEVAVDVTKRQNVTSALISHNSASAL